MPYPDNFNSAAFDAQFADEDRVTRDDARKWRDGIMGKMAPQIEALIAMVKSDYVRHLGRGAPDLTINARTASDVLEEMITDDMEWGLFDD